MSARIWQLQWAALGLLVIASGCGSPDNKKAVTVRPIQNGMKMPKDISQMPEAIAPNILPETHLAAGRLHESEGRLVRAVEQYRLAIAARPDNIEAYNRLGIVLDRLGKFKEADQALLRATQIAPKQAYLHNNLAFSYIMQGRWADAQACLTKALEIDSQFIRARVNMGTVLAQQGQFDEAFKNFRAVLRIEDAYYNMGLMYQSKQRVVEAAQAFQQALDANPKMVAAKKRLELLPPSAVSEAENRGELFAFTAALTGVTAPVAPATQPSAIIPASKTEDRPVPTTQPEFIDSPMPENMSTAVAGEFQSISGPGPAMDVPATQPESTEVAASDVQPVADTQPAAIETAASEPEPVPAPAVEPTEAVATAAVAESTPATQPATETTASIAEPTPAPQPAELEAAAPIAEPAPTTQPESSGIAVAQDQPAPTTQPDSTDVAMSTDAAAPAIEDGSDDESDGEYPPARQGILAMLAQPAEVICWSIEPIEKLMSLIAIPTMDDTTAVASPQPVDVAAPQAEQAAEDITVSPSPSSTP